MDDTETKSKIRALLERHGAAWVGQVRREQGKTIGFSIVDYRHPDGTVASWYEPTDGELLRVLEYVCGEVGLP